MKDFAIYIGTFGDINLANGAAKSIIKNCKDDYDLILLNFNDDITLTSKYFTDIVNIPMARRMGIFTITHLQETRKGIYIDDDIRLLDTISLIDRYNKGSYKTINGAMVVAWNDPFELWKKPFNTITNWRMHQMCELIDDPILIDLCKINRCEQIDSIWLHIDKGSDTRTVDRQKLIDYLDN